MADAKTKAVEYRELHEFPVDSFRDAARELRRPFTPEAVKWKIQTLLGQEKKDGKPDPKTAKGGLIVGYIDARLVIERLNLVCPQLWSHEFVSVAQGLLVCKLTVDGITREDVGQGAGKALWSDALKRAGVQFGVGVSLYAMKSVVMWRVSGEETTGNKLRPNRGGYLELDDHNREWLGEMYGRWLDDRGRRAFGPALDHGDEPGSVGDVDTDAPAVLADDAPEPRLNTVRSETARQRARELFGQLRAEKPRAMFPQVFEQKLGQAGHSQDALDALVVELEKKVAAVAKGVAA